MAQTYNRRFTKHPLPTPPDKTMICSPFPRAFQSLEALLANTTPSVSATTLLEMLELPCFQHHNHRSDKKNVVALQLLSHRALVALILKRLVPLKLNSMPAPQPSEETTTILKTSLSLFLNRETRTHLVQVPKAAASLPTRVYSCLTVCIAGHIWEMLLLVTPFD